MKLGKTDGNSEKIGKIDLIDRKIFVALAKNGRITITALADEVGLSKSPCQVRLARLEREGYIRGYRAILDTAKLGLDHVAFVEVKLSATTEKDLQAFNEGVLRIPEVEECHMVASTYDYLLKVRTTDIKSYRRVLGEDISSLPSVASTSTAVAMEAVKDSVSLSRLG